MADTDSTPTFAGITHLIVVLDKSGSMTGLAPEVISGFNNWLGEQKALPGEAQLTLTLFDTVVTTPITATPIAKVNPLDAIRYSPGGLTALYDAVHKSVQAVPVIPKEDRALVLIITDGQENSSKECNKAQMNALIKEKEGLGNWTFTYLSAAPDAFADAATAGVNLANTMSYDPTAAGTKSAFTNMSASTRSYRSGVAGQSASFYNPDPNSGAPGSSNVADLAAQLLAHQMASQKIPSKPAPQTTGWVTDDSTTTIYPSATQPEPAQSAWVQG